MIRWQEADKGVDNLIVQNGAAAFARAYEQLLSLATWLVYSCVRLTHKVDLSHASGC